MELVQIRAARLYLNRKMPVEQMSTQCRIPTQDVLHAIALYLKSRRGENRECQGCPWRSGDRPCVWPKGVCGL